MTKSLRPPKSSQSVENPQMKCCCGVAIQLPDAGPGYTRVSPPNRRGFRARMVQMRPFEQAVGRFRFLSNDRQQKSLGVGLPQAPCSHRSSSQTQANSPTRIGDASERDLQARYTWRFCSFKTLTRRRNPVSQLVMPVGVQIFAGP